MKKLIASIAMAIGLIAAAGQAQATSLITINDGTGSYAVSAFDWNPGSAVAVGAVPIATFPNSTDFTLLYQATLGNYLGASSNIITGTGLNTNYEITVVAGFQETGTLIGGNANFALKSGGTNFFQIYMDSAMNSNALAGTGYNDGTLILSGTVVSSNGTFLVTDTNGVTFDQSANGNQWGTQLTVSGTGATSLTAQVDTQDLSFFTSSINFLIADLFFNTSNVDPFQQVDPSQQFVSDASGTPYVVYDGTTSTLGDVNGLGGTAGTVGKDFEFQSDANTSFQVVPEPTTMLLSGLGMLGLGFFRRKAA